MNEKTPTREKTPERRFGIGFMIGVCLFVCFYVRGCSCCCCCYGCYCVCLRKWSSQWLLFFPVHSLIGIIIVDVAVIAEFSLLALASLKCVLLLLFLIVLSKNKIIKLSCQTPNPNNLQCRHPHHRHSLPEQSPPHLRPPPISHQVGKNCQWGMS